MTVNEKRGAEGVDRVDEARLVVSQASVYDAPSVSCRRLSSLDVSDTSSLCTIRLSSPLDADDSSTALKGEPRKHYSKIVKPRLDCSMKAFDSDNPVSHAMWETSFSATQATSNRRSTRPRKELYNVVSLPDERRGGKSKDMRRFATLLSKAPDINLARGDAKLRAATKDLPMDDPRVQEGLDSGFSVAFAVGTEEPVLNEGDLRDRFTASFGKL